MAVCIGIVLPVTASAGMTIGVSPSLVELAATPGGKGSQELTVYNDGTDPIQLVTGVSLFKDAEGERSAVDWLKVEPGTIDLPPGQQQKVKVSVVVPEGVQSGGRYAQVTFRTKANVVAGSGIGIAAQVGVPFYVVVQGPAPLTKQGTVDRVIPVLEPDGRVSFRAKFSNKGNVQLLPRGTVEVGRASGESVGKLTIPESLTVLPASDQLLATDVSLPLEAGSAYSAHVTVDYAEGSQASADAKFSVTAALSVEKLGVRENLDRGPTLFASLRNSGEVGLLPRLQFAIRDADGKVRGTAAPDQPPLLQPGATTDLEIQTSSRLPTGDYVLVARADYGGAQPLQQEAPFKIGNPLPTPNPAWGEGPARAKQPAVAALPIPVDQALLIPMAAGAVALLLLIVLLIWMSRRGKRRAAPVPARASASFGSTVSVPDGAAADRTMAIQAAAPEAVAVAAKPDVSRAAPTTTEQPPKTEPQQPPRPSMVVGAAEAVSTASSSSAASGNRTQMAASLVTMGRQAATQGDRAVAYRLMRQALEMDSRNVDAWIWRAATAESAEESVVSLETALLLDPSNERAKQGLATYQAQLAKERGKGERRDG